MDNWYKRRFRKIGYSFVAAGLAASMVFSSASSALAAVEPSLVADEESMAAQNMTLASSSAREALSSSNDSAKERPSILAQDKPTQLSQEQTSAAKATEAPRTSAPQTEAPQTEIPQTEAPQTEAPQTSAPQTEAPQTETPQTEAPQTSAPQTETPQTSAPQTETPIVIEPTTPSPLEPLDIDVPVIEPTDVVSTEDYSAIRQAIVKQARSLVGKVTYFWGGKSTAIGWDSRWGKPQVVTVSGSKSSGTTRYFGLDCSGYVAWVFANAYGTASILSRFGFNTPEQWANSYEISWQEVQIGDILFKTTPYSGSTNHIGVVVEIGEDGTIWVAHCSSSRNGVVVTAANNSGFKYIRRPNLFKGDVAAPAIVNLADLKIPQGVEISEAAMALSTVETAATRDWTSVDALAADLAPIFPDPVLAAAVAEGIWNVYAQIPEQNLNQIITSAVSAAGILKASEAAYQLASSTDEMRELHLDRYGFANILDLVKRAEITVKAAGPIMNTILTREEIEEEVIPLEVSVKKDIQTAADYVAVSAEADAIGTEVTTTFIRDLAVTDHFDDLAEILSNINRRFGSFSDAAAKGLPAGSESAVADTDTAAAEGDAANNTVDTAAAVAEGDAANTAAAEGNTADTAAAIADQEAAYPAAEPAEAAPAYVPVENIEGIQYLCSARMIDLRNNNIHDLLPLDYFRVNTEGAYIYNLSLYYKNDQGLWTADESGLLHEDGELKLYYGGGIPGSAQEYNTELLVSGNPLETIPEEYPGRLKIDFIEQGKAQDMALTVAMERFGLNQESEINADQAPAESIVAEEP